VEQWKIVRDRSQAGACCNRPKPAEAFAVLELPDCVRRDLCPMCFHELQQQTRAAGGKPPIFWRVQRKEDNRQPTLDVAMLRHLFDRLADEPGERAAALRYFVALLLLRKRILKMADGPGAEGADLVVFDPKAPSQPPVALVAPDLTEHSLDQLKDELLAAAGAAGEAEATA